MRARLSESEEAEEEFEASESAEDAEECAGRSGAAPAPGADAAAAALTISRSGSRRPVGMQDDAIDRSGGERSPLEGKEKKIGSEEQEQEKIASDLIDQIRPEMNQSGPEIAGVGRGNRCIDAPPGKAPKPPPNPPQPEGERAEGQKTRGKQRKG